VQFWSKVINIDFAFAKGECGVFANSLKRNGEGLHSPQAWQILTLKRNGK
jgi:hypothetical protein